MLEHYIKKYHRDTFVLTFFKLGFNMILRPHYDLNRLKQLIEDEQTRRLTRQSIKDANKAGFSETEMVDAILSLKHQDFYKSMPSELYNSIWQDVYKTTEKETKLYIKLQENPQGTGVVISFKIDEEGIYNVQNWR